MAGGLLGEVNLRLPFYVAAGLSLLNATYGFLAVPESLPPDRRSKFSLARANPLAALPALMRRPGVGGLVWVVALAVLAQLMLQVSWVLYTTFRFGWGPRDNGWALFTVGVVAVVVQGALMAPLLRRFGEERLAFAGLVDGDHRVPVLRDGDRRLGHVHDHRREFPLVCRGPGAAGADLEGGRREGAGRVDGRA